MIIITALSPTTRSRVAFNCRNSSKWAAIERQVVRWAEISSVVPLQNSAANSLNGAPYNNFYLSRKGRASSTRTRTALTVSHWVHWNNRSLTVLSELRIEEGGTLVIKPFDKINVECATIEGTIEIDMLDLEEEQYDSPFLYFSCGDTAMMKVQAQGKVCTVSTNIREKDGKQLFTAAVTCPDTSLDRGT